LYWTNIPGVTQPEDKGLVLSDVLESGVVDRDKSFCLDANYWKGGNLKSYFEKHRRQLVFDTTAVAAMRGRYLVDGVRQDGKGATAGNTQQYVEFRYDGKTNALTTVGKDNIVVPFVLDGRIPVADIPYRKLTPIECERLQTVPDGYTACVSDTQRYRMLGNGWTVDVIAHILRCVPNVEITGSEAVRVD
jgi:site-specific DNA-cytosine methylase